MSQRVRASPPTALSSTSKIHTGVFYDAAGAVNMGDEVEASMFGAQDPDLYFYGELRSRSSVLVPTVSPRVALRAVFSPHPDGR